MAKRKIDAYALGWQVSENRGKIKLRFIDGATTLINADAADFAAFAALLVRGDTYYDEDDGIVTTTWEGDW